MKEAQVPQSEEGEGSKKGFSLHEEEDYRKPWRIFRIMSEFVMGYQLLSSLEKEVTILGSARSDIEDKYYNIAEDIGGLLAQNDYTTVTGGGPGIMEAANKGAYDEGGESIGLSIQLPHEQQVNQYVKRVIGFHYFSTRKVMLTAPADAFVLFPGGFGTMDEFFEIVDNMELGKMCDVPVVLVGEEYWQPLIDFLKESGCDLGSIDREQVESWHVVENAQQAFEVIDGKHDGGVSTCELSPTHFHSESSMNWRVFRIMSELVEGFEFISDLEEDVSFYGTKSIQEDSDYYDAGYELGKSLADNGFATLTGAAPGMDEAVNKGAMENGGDSIGISMKVHGQTRMNEYINKSLVFDFPFTRKMIITAPSDAFVFFPGGFGTMHQLFEILTLMQNNKIDKRPIILYDHDFWGQWHIFIKKKLHHRFETIGDTDDEIYQIVDDVDTIMEIINNRA